MLRRNKFIVITFTLLIFAIFIGYWFKNFTTEKAILEGRVLKTGLVKAGDEIAAGDILMKINGLVGPVPASRSSVDGKVIKVYVKPGDTVESGQSIALIKKQKK